MINLVTDRTEADSLLGTAKGQYNADDLNRVESAVAELCDLALSVGVALDLVTKTDWSLPGDFQASDWPTESQMRRYIGNVTALCDAFSVVNGSLPNSMSRLTWAGANAIEESLVAVYSRVQGTLDAYRYSGEFYAGEEISL